MKIYVNNISKKIKDHQVLSDVNLTLESGNIYGFVGRNGSGKTMLFRAISGLMRIDSGTIMLDDRQLHKDFEIMPGLGIILENAGLYPEFTGYKNLKLLAN
jgi:ABC-2 type transport system ATP-binding protein